MDVRSTDFPGVLLFQGVLVHDERGSFERIWCREALEQTKPSLEITQVSLACNPRAGTVRGLHFSVEPHEETKFLRCLSGAIFDVVVDIQPASATYGRYLSFQLTQGDGVTLCISPGYAHGYQTLTDEANIVYVIDRPYVAHAARTIRYNDPTIGILWPLPVTCVGERDAHADLL